MKCNAWVPTKQPTTSGWKQQRADLWMTRLQMVAVTGERLKMKLAEFPKEDVAAAWGLKPSNIKECGGKIVADMSAKDEPYFGGTSARLSIEYKCQKCGCTVFHELPNEMTISQFLTEYIAQL